MIAYTAIGLKADHATTWLLPRLVGMRVAQDMALANRRVGSDEAVALGLISRGVDDSQLADEVAKTAQALSRAATPVLRRFVDCFCRVIRKRSKAT